MRFTAAFKQISNSGIFDVDFYLGQFPNPTDVRIRPILHYLIVGGQSGKNPHPLFDSQFYRENNRGVKESGIDAFVHYLSIGAAKGFDPHPLFSSQYYLSQCKDQRTAAQNPLAHYLSTGVRRSVSPHPLFDYCFYRSQIASDQEKEDDLLSHFIRQGAQAKLSPHPLFDTAFYKKHHPEVFEIGINPLTHFIISPPNKTCFPHPLFDCVFYLQNNKDVSAACTNPLLHFTQFGANEGRSPHPLFDINYYRSKLKEQKPGINPLIGFLNCFGKDADPHLLFDSEYLLQQVPELKTAETNALIYFLEQPEGLDPHPCFKSDFYLSNASVELDVGENALVHFLTKNEGYKVNPNELFDAEYYGANSAAYQTSKLDPLSHYLSSGAKIGDAPSSIIDLSNLLKDQRRLVLSDTLAAVREVWDGDEEFRKTTKKGGASRKTAATESPATIASRRRNWINWYSETSPDLSIIIHSCAEQLFLESTLKAIWLYTAGKKYEIIVADTTGSGITLKHYDTLTGPYQVLEFDKSFSNTAALNLAASKAKGEFLFFLQAGELPLENWLQSLLKEFESDSKVLAATPRILSPDGRLLAAGLAQTRSGEFRAVGTGFDRKKQQFRTAQSVDAGRNILVRKSLFEEMGGVDERFQSTYGIADLCSKLAKKGLIVFSPQSSIVLANRNDRRWGMSFFSEAESFDRFSVTSESFEKLFSGQNANVPLNHFLSHKGKETRKTNRGKVVIFSDAPSTCGSSESYVVALVHSLSASFDVLLHSSKEVLKATWLRISDRLHMPLEGSQFELCTEQLATIACDVLYVVGDISGDENLQSGDIQEKIWITGVQNQSRLCRSNSFGHTMEMLKISWDQMWFPSEWHQLMFKKDWPNFQYNKSKLHTVPPPIMVEVSPLSDKTRHCVLIHSVDHEYLPELVSASLPMIKEIDGLSLSLICEFDLNDIRAKPLQKLIRRHSHEIEVLPYPSSLVFGARCRSSKICWSTAGMKKNQTSYSENSWAGLLPVLRAMTHGCLPMIYKTTFNDSLMGELTENSWQSMEALVSKSLGLFDNQQKPFLVKSQKNATTLAAKFDFSFFNSRVHELLPLTLSLL